MIVSQTMNTPLAGFHSSSIICQAIKLPMEDLRDTLQAHTRNTFGIDYFLLCLGLCFAITP